MSTIQPGRPGSPTTRHDLLVLGDANPDLVVTGAPHTLTFGQAERRVATATLTLGGSGALVAHAAARLGLRTAFVGLLGEDAAADLVLGRLTAAGVDLAGARREEGMVTGTTIVFVRPDGDRAILTAPGSLDSFGPEHVDTELLTTARHVHVASVFLQPKLSVGLAGLLSTAKASGATTSMDTNDDPSGRWELDDVALTYVDYLLPNSAEAMALATVYAGKHGLSPPGDTLSAARLLAVARRAAVVKCGADGAMLVDGRHVLRAQLATKAPDLVDTIGAGDAFDAGFIAGVLRNLPLADSLRLAVAVGTLSTRRVGGADGQPDASEAGRLAASVIVEVDGG